MMIGRVVTLGCVDQGKYGDGDCLDEVYDDNDDDDELKMGE